MLNLVVQKKLRPDFRDLKSQTMQKSVPSLSEVKDRFQPMHFVI